MKLITTCISLCLATGAVAITLDEADAVLDAKEASEESKTPVAELDPVDPAPPVIEQKGLADAVPTSGEVQGALDMGVRYLKALCATNHEGWLLPPVLQRKIIDIQYTQVLEKYSMKMVDVPIWEYETVTQMVQRTRGESVNSVKVLEKKVSRRAVRQIGTKKEEKLVLDPNGTIERSRNIRKHIYGEGGPDQWRLYQMGCNAMGAYAILRATQDPSDESVRTIADHLNDIIMNFGLPDTTWDLVWITALFSEMEEKRFKEMARKSAGKILDGQINHGAADGMWGPVCLNPKVLAESMKIQMKMGAEMRDAAAKYSAAYSAAERASKARGGKKADREAQKAETAKAETEDALQEFMKELALVTMTGTESLTVDKKVTLSSHIAAPLQLVGLPQYIYNQTSADTESTALAVFGLMVAARNGCIPPMTEHPKNAKGVPFVPNARASDILQRTLALIVRAQHKTGAFAENNFVLPVTDFNGLPFPGLPPKQETFKPLPMPITLASCVYGLDAVMNTARIFGPSTGARLAPHFNAGYEYIKQSYEEAAQSKDDNGFIVPPYDYYFWFYDALRGAPVKELKGVTDDLLKNVIGKQGTDGSWKSGTKNRFIMPSSHRERIKAFPARYSSKERDFDLAQAHVPYKVEAQARAFYGIDDSIMSTAYTILMLADYLKETSSQEPAAGGEQKTTHGVKR